MASVFCFKRKILVIDVHITMSCASGIKKLKNGDIFCKFLSTHGNLDSVETNCNYKYVSIPPFYKCIFNLHKKLKFKISLKFFFTFGGKVGALKGKCDKV